MRWKESHLPLQNPWRGSEVRTYTTTRAANAVSRATHPPKDNLALTTSIHTFVAVHIAFRSRLTLPIFGSFKL